MNKTDTMICFLAWLYRASEGAPVTWTDIPDVFSSELVVDAIRDDLIKSFDGNRFLRVTPGGAGYMRRFSVRPRERTVEYL